MRCRGNGCQGLTKRHRRRIGCYGGRSLSAGAKGAVKTLLMDQRAQVRFDLRAASPPPRLPPPVAAKAGRCQRTSDLAWTIVITVRIDGTQRYSWTKNQRSWFVSRTRPRRLRRTNIPIGPLRGGQSSRMGGIAPDQQGPQDELDARCRKAEVTAVQSTSLPNGLVAWGLIN